jgi:hypothetical protein
MYDRLIASRIENLLIWNFCPDFRPELLYVCHDETNELIILSVL